MILLSQELPLSISLNQDTYRNAAQFARAGFEAAECCLPVHYHAEVDLSIFPAYLEEVCPRIADGGLRIASFHLPFGTYWDISSPDETIRAGAVQALAQLIRLLAPYPGNNLVLHPSFEPIEEGAREAHIAACQKSLRELAPIAEETGKKIALENLPRTCLGRTSQEMERITESGHWVPGTGSLHWREIFAALIALPYGGTYNFEVFKYAPLEIVGGLKNALER